MKLWLIEQNQTTGYDTYDSAVVVAEDEEAARNVNPDGAWGRPYPSWALTPDNVAVHYIGEASPHLAVGEIVCASFNAG